MARRAKVKAAAAPLRLAFRTPAPNAPGFLRRQMRGLAIIRDYRAMERESSALQKDGAAADDPRWQEIGERTFTLLDGLIAFMLEFVQHPADRAEARALIEDLSESELMGILPGLLGSAPPLARSTSASKPPGS